MGRIRGIANFNANFEPQIASPLDARSIVEYKSDLILESTWQANDGIVYAYKGMIVSVVDDTTGNNGLYILNDDDYTIESNWNKISGGYSGATNTKKYTNLTPTEIEIGGIKIGTIFSGLTINEVFDMLFYPELYPELTNPYSTFVLNESGLHEINSIITLNFTLTFNRGSIIPEYGTSGYRSGLPNLYEYNGTGLIDTPSNSLIDIKSIPNYVVLSGTQTWEGRVRYDEGEQPKTNKGNDYDVKLPSGHTNWISNSIIGVYPYFGTSVNITTQTKQPLALHNANYWQIDMVAESGSNKQIAWFPQSFNAITGIQFFNTVSNSWEWIGGSKLNSLLSFTVTTTQININGLNVDYNIYTHNGSLIGARQLRFYSV